LAFAAEEPPVEHPAEQPVEHPAERPQVFTSQRAFLKAAEIEHTSDFENLTDPHLDHPFTFEGVTYATPSERNPDRMSGHLISLNSSKLSRTIQNNSFPDLTVTFGKQKMVTAIGFHVIPSMEAAGDWEITLSTPMGKTFIESRSYKAEVESQFFGFIHPPGIVSVRISRPKGHWSPNHKVDNLSRSAIVPYERTLEVIGVENRWLGLLVTTSRRPAGRTSAPLEATVAGMWKDAGIGMDPKYTGLFREDARREARAPLDMRRVVVYWPGEKRLRSWPEEMGFTCRDNRVTLSWHSEIATAAMVQLARDRIHSALDTMDYREVDKENELDAFAERFGITRENIEYWAHSNEYGIYSRRIGETELGVLCEVNDYVGGRVQWCGVKLNWLVSRAYPHSQPTLGDVHAVMPDGLHPPYLDRSFFVALKRESVEACNAGRGIGITFQDDVYKQLVSSLETNGFEYEREHEPNRHGGTQKTWERYADATYAHITTHSKTTRTRFSCQMPQHKGEPRTVKPLPKHPSMRLPLSKRPQLEFEELQFATETLEQQTRLFHKIAEGIAQDDWFIQRYKDARYSPQPRYVASWQTTEERGTSYLRGKMPYRSLSIALTGTAVDDGDRLERGTANGRWVPGEGWAATVSYALGKYPSFVGTATAGQVHPQTPTFSFATGRRDTVSLLQPRLSVTTKQGTTYSYSYEARWPAPTHGDVPPEVKAEARQRFFALYESPERLRDIALECLGNLRKLARDEISSRKNIRMRAVRVQRPPAPAPDPLDPQAAPDDETLAALMEAIEAELNRRETTIRENYTEIYAAINRALPIAALRDALEDVAE